MCRSRRRSLLTSSCYIRSTSRVYLRPSDVQYFHEFCCTDPTILQLSPSALRWWHPLVQAYRQPTRPPSLPERPPAIITDWIQQHSLNPNHQKTQLLIISRSRKPTTHSISLNGHTLTLCSEVKYLGVTISNNLTWSRHINNITKSTKRLLGRIHRKFHDAPNHLRLKLQYFLSSTTVVLFWTPTKLPTMQSQLENIQKFAGRISTKNWSSDYPSLCVPLNLKSLSARRQIQKLKLCYNILTNNSCLPSRSFHSPPPPISSVPKLQTAFHTLRSDFSPQSLIFCWHCQTLEYTTWGHHFCAITRQFQKPPKSFLYLYLTVT